LSDGAEWDESRVAELASRQHGVVTARQLAQCGLDKDTVARRVGAGWLTRLHRGVYLVGSLPAQFSAEMAAVLACGTRALLSHHSAAAVWGFRPAHEGDPHVTVQGRDVRPGRINVHRTTEPLTAALRHRLPLTTPARTLLDLAALLPQRDLDRAVEQAQILRLADRATLLRCPSRRGIRALHQSLEHEPQLTRSEAEHRLLALIRAASLPPPRTNVRIHGHEVDLIWPRQRLIVEVDGFAFHSSRTAFERDRRRDAELQARGYRVVRLTWRQIVREPEAVVARVATLLAIP
jgi:very-short-patch-repair endonuclease